MDIISQLIITMKNGSLANKESVLVPYSKLKNSILACLEKEGFISSFSKKTKKGQAFIEINLVYNDNKPKIVDVERVSKPSKRVYIAVKEIFPVKNGKGLMVISTPKGILGGKDARKEQVGGEVLFKVW